MNILSKFVILHSVLQVLLSAQPEMGMPRKNRSEAFPFFYQAVNFPITDSLTNRVDVFLQVPFNKVQFAKEDNGFKAEYSAVIAIYDSSLSELMQEKIFNEKIVVNDFDQTHSRSNSNISIKSFVINPGIYSLRVSVTDKDSRREYKAEKRFVVKKFKHPVAVSDIVIIRDDENRKGKMMVPIVSKVISGKHPNLKFYCELYSDSIRNLPLSYCILNMNKGLMVRYDLQYPAKKGINILSYTFDSLSIPSGDYYIQAAVLDTNLNPIEIALSQFTLRLPGLPLSIKNLDKAVEELLYIASTSELDSIKDCKDYDHKLRLFNEFWRKRDPSEAAEENEIFEEYYRRVDFANENFSHFSEGWKSDMGMVYIMLGAPSNIERHPFDINSKPYEIWEYYQLNQKIVFIDSSGFGDYRLTTPLSGDLYRFR